MSILGNALNRLKNEYKSPIRFLVYWLAVGSIVGALCGSASALFLAGLAWVTETREANAWLLFGLPFGGALISWLYMKAGGSSIRGNNLILERIHDGPEAVPLRMTPLVLLGTLVTHLFGGSAGREGTAVQMGGSLAEWTGKLLRIDADNRRILLMCGISGGFGSVFGTPLAGTVFALEVLAAGSLRHRALLPCLIAAVVGHAVTTAWGIPHTHHFIGEIPALTVWVAVKLIVASLVFGITSALFVSALHACKLGFARLSSSPVKRSFAGGTIVAVLTLALGTRDYLGLGLPLIAQSFEGDAAALAFLWKLLFTAITLGAGFIGGEVTPLFAIGAALGSTLAGVLALPAPLLAALGLAAVFGAAAKTPLACFILGLELFGAEAGVYFLIACTVSWLFSGTRGIYAAQKQSEF